MTRKEEREREDQERNGEMSSKRDLGQDIIGYQEKGSDRDRILLGWPVAGGQPWLNVLMVMIMMIFKPVLTAASSNSLSSA